MWQVRRLPLTSVIECTARAICMPKAAHGYIGLCRLGEATEMSAHLYLNKIIYLQQGWGKKCTSSPDQLVPRQEELTNPCLGLEHAAATSELSDRDAHQPGAMGRCESDGDIGGSMLKDSGCRPSARARIRRLQRLRVRAPGKQAQRMAAQGRKGRRAGDGGWRWQLAHRGDGAGRRCGADGAGAIDWTCCARWLRTTGWNDSDRVSISMKSKEVGHLQKAKLRELEGEQIWTIVQPLDTVLKLSTVAHHDSRVVVLRPEVIWPLVQTIRPINIKDQATCLLSHPKKCDETRQLHNGSLSRKMRTRAEMLCNIFKNFGIIKKVVFSFAMPSPAIRPINI
ncbi:hypothetical protein GGX14DRAFT_392394 [Mycena pura]|uniref:Uncharacterized protein n=1 Tax=Mycena pura TaxID=153505 RepID=A0AAD6YJ57_9AGAR|nr:hypothetical protein GGX14DRAFT_392394 [Mycena pura]